MPSRGSRFASRESRSLSSGSGIRDPGSTNREPRITNRESRIANHEVFVIALTVYSFGGLALLLAGIGVYGVVTYSVTQRTAELGLRIALGAHRAGLLWLVIRGTLTLVIIAVLLGVTAAFRTSSLLASFMYGIQPAEPWVYSVTMALLITIGLLSSVGPTPPGDAHRPGRDAPLGIATRDSRLAVCFPVPRRSRIH